MQAKQRLNYGKQSRLCFKCLQPFTRNHTCSKQACRQCHHRHHTLLHLDRHTQPNDKGSTNHNRPAEAKGNSTAEVNTYCTFKGKARNHILLATAVVEVQNKSGQYVPCRALLDSASQSHFITGRCVKRSRLSRTQTHASLQGISNVNTATHHSVSLHLKSRHTDWHNTIQCAILSNITGTTPSTKMDTSSWKFLRTLSWLTNSLIKQEALIYFLELTYSTRCFDQAGVHDLATTQFYKKQFLAGYSLVKLQLLPHRLTLSIHSCYDRTTVWSTT